MKISERWLREWVSPPIDTAGIVRQLTMAGLEVESVEPAAKAVSDVVVGAVLAVQPHPDAERLRVCRVSDGREEFEVVCGAPNVRAGMRVPFARVGARLGDLVIRRAKLRGVESFGMLCSAEELGLAASSDGLLELPADAAPGTDVSVLLGLDDSLIALKVTPNRGDCLSLRGVARELAALNGMDWTPVAGQPVAARIDATLGIRLDAPAACPRYAGRLIRGIDIGRPSPLWMQERLRRAGLRSIDAVVDVTNYILLELGQPLHAFDAAKLTGGIVVRMARPAERLALLDGSEVELDDTHLVIADEAGAVALAGIMGGAGSAVSASTRDIFLEAAFFAPTAMAGRARGLGMHTDASQRFERGVDFELAAKAIERATEILLAVVGGEPGPVSIVTDADQLPVLAPIRLRAARLAMMLGVDLAADTVEDLLRRLGLAVEPVADGWRVTPPSHRFDIRIEADLIEEVARLHGYDNIPLRVQPMPVPMRARAETRTPLGDLRRHLIARGFQEAITYSFVEPAIQQFLDPGYVPVPVANPISADMAVMRTTLWTGLLKAVQFNQNRQQRRVRLFESGLRFLPLAGGLQQRPAIAGVATGTRAPEGWANGTADLDFHDLKGEVEALLDLANVAGRCSFERSTHPALHPGQSAAVLREGVLIGDVGALHPRLVKQLDLLGPVFAFEFDLEYLCKKNLPCFKGLSRFPEVRRDIAIVVDEAVPAAQLIDLVRESAGEWLVDVILFDRYAGQGVEKGKKSIAIGIVLQRGDQTLTDVETAATTERVIESLAQRFGATLRV